MEGSAPIRRGRPRDPDIEARVHDAVITVYWQTGWAAFSLDAVAKTAGVGRAALYRRWSSKLDLLTDVLNRRIPLADSIDTGSTRDDLRELALQLLAGYRTRDGLVSLRVALDARVHPDLLASLVDSINATRFMAVREIVKRAIARGDLPPDTSVTLLLEQFTGAILSHVLFAHRLTSDDQDAQYAQRLVEAMLP